MFDYNEDFEFNFGAILKVFNDDSFVILTPADLTEQTPTTDMLLDTYNDYINLHKTFGDQYYMTVAEEVMNQLRG